MTNRIQIGTHLTESGVVAILRGGDGRHLESVAVALIGAGIRSLEITTNTVGYDIVLPLLRKEYGSDVELGLGTVRTPGDVTNAARLGAEFVVAPNTNEEVGECAREAELGWIPGAHTPTEIERAWALGAGAVKIFPAEQAGGPAYLRAVRAPLDDVALLPTGGVAIEQIEAYVRAGAVAVGIGSPLIGDSLSTGRVDDVAGRARAALDGVQKGRQG